ncbi:hypothetical protein JW935_04610 [candidate division KSB1 bacterium]|nr:hypothetical protein [candidate division KSB1 bacterium]
MSCCRPATGKGATAGLFMGVVTSGGLFWLRNRLFTCPEPFLYIAWWSFVTAIFTTVVFSLLTKPEQDHKLTGLVYTKS